MKITTTNFVGALMIGGFGAMVGSEFGRGGVGWGVLVGAILGFLFPIYPIVFTKRIVGWLQAYVFQSRKGHGENKK
jgi:hypothetical protein